MNHSEKVPLSKCGLAWSAIFLLLVSGLLMPVTICYLLILQPSGSLAVDYRLFVPLTIATLFPLLAMHLYRRHLQSFIRWELWFGSIQVSGWALTAWGVAWMTCPEILTAHNARVPRNGDMVYGYVVFCFAIWLITPVLVAASSWVLRWLQRWWTRQKNRTGSDAVSPGDHRLKKAVTLRAIAAWTTLLAVAMSLVFSKGKLAEVIWEKANHPEALFVWGMFAVISLISIIIFGKMNLWLKKFRPYAIGLLAMLTLLPTLPLLTPVLLVTHGGFEVKAIYWLCFLLFLISCVLIAWRWALSVVAPDANIVERTSSTGNKLGVTNLFRWIVVAATILWLCLLVSLPVTHSLLVSEDTTVEALRRQMIELHGGDPEKESDWLDGLNRSLGAGLAPEDNAIVDLVELRLERLAVLKNANGGMETIREYFKKLGASSELAASWESRLERIGPTTSSFRDGGYGFETAIDQLRKRQAKLLSTPQGRKWYGLDELFDEEGEEAGTEEIDDLLSADFSHDRLEPALFQIDAADIRKLKSDRDIAKAFLATHVDWLFRIPWKDGDAPLAAKWLKENRPRVEKLRQLSKKKSYSPWVRLADQAARENCDGNDSRRPCNPALVLCARDSQWLSISLMNHLGNENFEAAMIDLEAIARLCDRSWLVELTEPTFRASYLSGCVRRVRGMILVAACHPSFPAELGSDLLDIFRALPAAYELQSNELLDLKANLLADCFHRSASIDFNWRPELEQLSDDPIFVFATKFPRYIDWRPLAETIDKVRRDAIQKHETSLVEKKPPAYEWTRPTTPITETYFQDLFFTGPTGKGKALAAMLESTSCFRVYASWYGVDHLDSTLDEVALCLELFQNRERRYPLELSELTPDFFESIPLDPVSEADELVYQISHEGYQLYSVGRNGVDDGGNYRDDVFKRPNVDLVEAIRAKLRF
jgi:hypothetical protein